MSVILMSKVIIFPTDTVYGIGCPIFDIKGIEKIYKLSIEVRISLLHAYAHP